MRGRRARSNNISGKLEQLIETSAVSLPDCPPQLATENKFTRWVRLHDTGLNYTGAALTYAIQPQLIATQDYKDYGLAANRWNQMRVRMIRVWFANTDPAAVGLPTLELQDAYSAFAVSDRAGPGVDWAKVAIRPCFQSRGAYYVLSSTSTLATVTVSAAAGVNGQVVIDCLVDFN